MSTCLVSRVLSSSYFVQTFFFFWPLWVTCGILVPQPGIESVLPALGVQNVTHWTTTKVLMQTFLFFQHNLCPHLTTLLEPRGQILLTLTSLSFFFIFILPVSMMILSSCNPLSLLSNPARIISFAVWLLSVTYNILTTSLCFLSVHSCPTLYSPTNYSPPGSSVHGISQARILKCVSIPSSRGFSRTRDWTHNSCIDRQALYHSHHLGSPNKWLLERKHGLPKWR